MRSIAIYNIDHEMGTSSVCLNLAAGLARSGHKTLIIDMEEEIYSKPIHLGKYLAISPRIHTLPPSGYDYCLIHCPKGVGSEALHSLSMADEVIISTTANLLGYHALNRSVRAIVQNNQNSGSRLSIKHILVNAYDEESALCRQALSCIVDEFTSELVLPLVPADSMLHSAIKHNQSVFSFAPQSRGAHAFQEIVSIIDHSGGDVQIPEPVQHAIEPSSGLAMTISF